MCLITTPPAREFREDEDGGDEEHGDGPFSAAGGVGYILWFCFGWRGVSLALLHTSKAISKRKSIQLAKLRSKRTYENNQKLARYYSSPQTNPRPVRVLRSRSSPALLAYALNNSK